MAIRASATAQTASPQAASLLAKNAAQTADNAVMLTVILEHDPSRPLSKLNAQLQRQGYDRNDQALKSAFRPATRAIDCSIAGPDKVPSRKFCST